MKGKKLKEKGITLIALVVTIIILLILAGVAIASVTGDNGLFRKAREATNMYKDSERDEQGTLSVVKNELSKMLNGEGSNPETPPKELEEGTIEYAINKITGEETEPTEVTIGGKTVFIPPSFTISKESAETVDGGIVVEDKNGNQWVWIPCYVDGGVGALDANVTKLTKYDRYDFERSEYGIYSKYSEDLNLNDKASIEQFGGYYIGRYEAGRESESASEVLIQKDKIPYKVNIEGYDNVVLLANGLVEANEYDSEKIVTKICSSYAWDTALKFIAKTHPEYPTTSYDKDGNLVGQYGTGQLNTGKTAAVCNIYDMGGNVWEFTSELYEGQRYYENVVRGVDLNYSSGVSCCAGYRMSAPMFRDDLSFRTTLYLKSNV